MGQLSPPSILAFLLISSVTLVSPSLQSQYDLDHSEEIDLVHRHTSGMSKTDVTLQAMGKPKERPKNLTCHVCYSETSGVECMNFSTIYFSPSYVSSSMDGDDGGERDNEVHRHWSQDSLPTNGFHGFAQQCHNESYVCSVRKFAFSLSNGTGHAPMKTFALKRNCTLVNKCEPGCVVMGERTRIYVCSTCCTSDLCNTGNGAGDSKTRHGSLLWWIFASMMMPFYFCSYTTTASFASSITIPFLP